MIFIGLGSSIGAAEKIFKSAEQCLVQREMRIIRKSTLFLNPPYGGIAKNQFTNAVWEVKTALSPANLLQKLQEAEEIHGRERKERWADRTLDLDLLLYHDQVINTSELTLPHPGIPKRNFVLIPLQELVGNHFKIPNMGTVGNLLNALDKG